MKISLTSIQKCKVVLSQQTIGLKWIEIFFRMHILNSEYFFLDLIGCNWIEKLHLLFKIFN